MANEEYHMYLLIVSINYSKKLSYIWKSYLLKYLLAEFIQEHKYGNLRCFRIKN